MKSTSTPAIVAMVLALTLVGSAQKKDSAETLLGAGLHQEEVEENCKDAIKIYERVVRDKSTPHNVAARAQLHIGYCQEKLGAREATVAYQLVLSRYADQSEAVAAAQSRITALGGPRNDGGPIQRLVATGADADRFGFITPDGRWLSRPDWPVGDMVLRDMFTGQTRRLLNKAGSDPSSVYRAIVSPDGRTVAYVWLTSDGNQDRYELNVRPLSGGTPRTLMVAAGLQFPEVAAWSPDSKSILVNMIVSDGSSQLSWVAADDGAVRVIKELGWRRRRFTPNRPSLSPNGRFIAYAALPANPAAVAQTELFDTAEQHIYLLSADGATESEAVTGNSVNESPVWTPDGSQMLFVSNRSGSFSLWTIGVREGKGVGQPAILLKDIGRIRHIGMTRSGSLYYSRGDGGAGSQDVFTARVDRDGAIRGPAVRLANRFVDQNRDPVFSPDGKSIAFVRGRQSLPSSPRGLREPPSFDLVIHSADTDEEVVHRVGSLRMPPVWFHDNTSLLVERNGDLFQMNAVSGEFNSLGVAAALQPNLGAVPAGVTVPLLPLQGPAVLSPDDKLLYMTQGRGLVVFDLSTRQRRALWTAAKGTVLSFALSPDGRSLAVTSGPRLGFLHSLTRVATDGSGDHELSSAAFGSLAWSRDGRWIYFSGDLQERQQLMRISADGAKPPEPAGSLTEEVVAMSFSPDGSRVVFSAGTRAAELWVLDNLTSLLTKR